MGSQLSRINEETRKFDDYAYAVTTIDEEHRLTHDGYTFKISYIVSALVTTGEHDLLIRIPAGKGPPHIRRWRFKPTNAPCTVEFFENTTYSAAGAAVTPVCHNRTKKTVAGTLFSTGPTITADGDVLDTQLATTAAKDTGSPTDSFGEEWIFDADGAERVYLIRLTNTSGGNIDVGVEIFFYELPYGKDTSSLVFD